MCNGYKAHQCAGSLKNHIWGLWTCEIMTSRKQCQALSFLINLWFWPPSLGCYSESAPEKIWLSYFLLCNQSTRDETRKDQMNSCARCSSAWGHIIIFMCRQLFIPLSLFGTLFPSAQNPYLSLHSGNYSNEHSLPSHLFYSPTWSIADNVRVILCDAVAHSDTSFQV